MEKTIKELGNKIESLQEIIEQEVGNSTMDLILELVDLNIELEKECNR